MVLVQVTKIGVRYREDRPDGKDLKGLKVRKLYLDRGFIQGHDRSLPGAINIFVEDTL